jgi:hypothetical protein
MIFLRRNNWEYSQSITAPEQLEAASESEISFIGNKNMKIWPTPKLLS